MFVVYCPFVETKVFASGIGRNVKGLVLLYFSLALRVGLARGVSVRSFTLCLASKGFDVNIRSSVWKPVRFWDISRVSPRKGLLPVLGVLAALKVFRTRGAGQELAAAWRPRLVEPLRRSGSGRNHCTQERMG